MPTSHTHPQITPPQWLYDRIMVTIEPDLVSTEIDGLDAKYVHESPEERAERMERYRLAYIAFNDALDQMGSYMFAYVKDTKVNVKTQRLSAEKTEASSEQARAEQLLSTFSPSL